MRSSMNTLIKIKMDEVYQDLQRELVKYQDLKADGWGLVVKSFIEYKLQEIKRLSETYDRLCTLHDRNKR
jgi:hypothetical protein